MSFSYYKLLFFSLAITVGLYLVYYVYRSYIKRVTRAAGSPRGFARMLPLEISDSAGELQFRFAIDSEQVVKLEICSDDFQSLFILSEKNFNAGEHVIRFDSSKLAKGIYYYKLKTPRQEIIKKFEFGA